MFSCMVSTQCLLGNVHGINEVANTTGIVSSIYYFMGLAMKLPMFDHLTYEKSDFM